MAPHTHIPAPRNTIETYSARPERDPPRNENGEIICTHTACRDKNETFRRPCEWNKHMDKHERPYKCNEPTCEQNPGFTYSGGLLRHMREVHKKGVGPTRRPLYCPHANCIRSTGEGFTRRENLEEHLRRRHSYTGHYSPPPQSSDSNNEETGDQPRKRRKTVDPESPGVEQFNQQSQIPVQTIQDSRRESLRTDPMLEDRPYGNGSDSDLDRSEALRQLTLARQTIAEQQELIRQKDVRLHLQETDLQRLQAIIENGSNAAARPSDHSFTAPAVTSPSLLATLAQGDAYRTDTTAQGPPVNGVSHASPTGQQDSRRGSGSQGGGQQQRSDKDAQVNGSAPSRRIEIDRDLVSERLASKTT